MLREMLLHFGERMVEGVPHSLLEVPKGHVSVEGNCSDVGNPTSDAHPATVFAMEWLHALLTKAPPPDKVGFIYMLKGGWDFSNTDPYATKPTNGRPTITGPHVMVVGPAVKALPGYDRTGEGANTAIPYVMWKDTPYEHLMIPVH